MKKWLEYLENPYNVMKVFGLFFLTVSVLFFGQRVELVLFLALGFLWPFFKDSEKLKMSIEKKKYRFSFVRFYLGLNAFVDEAIKNAPETLKIFLRPLVPTLLFFALGQLIQSKVQVWPIFLGGFAGEVYKRLSIKTYH